MEGIGREKSLDIIDVLKNQTFSILLDESTDVSVTQMLALVVRYVNANTMQTVDRCFDIIKVLDGTSLGLFKAVSNVLFEKHSIPPKNLIGLGADKCATMMGKVSEFQAQLKEACPHIFVNGCICHSLALCLSHASKKLPAWIENFIRDICSYFSHSSKRKQKFENIQKLCDHPRHAILKIAQTRWLSHQQVVERILEQWESLHTFFQQEVTSLAEKDLSHKARDLASGFTSDAKARLSIMVYVLHKVNSLNLLFQSEDFTLHKVYSEAVDILTTLMSMYMKSSDPLQNPRNPHNFLCLEQIKIGVCAQLELNTLNDSVKKAIRTDCLSFLVELCFQIKQRINLSEMKLLSVLDPVLAMKSHQNCPSILPIISKFCHSLDENELDALGDEWDELPNVLKIHCTEDVTSMTPLSSGIM